jgi:hypothetical protein
MKTFRSIPLALLFLSSTARAELPIRIGLGPSFDLQGDPLVDGVGNVYRCSDRPMIEPILDDNGVPIPVRETWDCGAGPSIGGRLVLHARVRLSDRAALRIGPRLEGGTRSGAVQYQCATAQYTDSGQTFTGGPGSFLGVGRPCEGDAADPNTTITSGGHFGSTVLIGLAIGPEFSVPVGSNSLYFGAELSGGVAWSFDSLGPAEGGNYSPTDGVIDDFKEDGCANCNVEAFGFPAFFGAELLAGYRLGGDLPLFFEAGYSSARISAFNMKPGYDSTVLTSLAYTWNPIRLSVGVEIEL